MASKSALAAIMAMSLAACAAGGGVDDLSLPAMPLVRVKGHVDFAGATANGGGHPLHAALVWGAVPNYVEACLKYPANADLQKACPNPFGFVPGQVEATMPVGQDGAFEFALDHLPATNVSVGTDASRIAWGSIVVAADTDGDGAFNFFEPNPGRGGGATIGDRVVAASFTTLTASQERIGFLEGKWDPTLLDLFYPFADCPTPRAGFSVLSTPGVYLASDTTLLSNLGTCTDDGLDHVVDTPLLLASDAKALTCRAATNHDRVQQPPKNDPTKPSEGDPGGTGPGGPGGAPPPAVTPVCLDATTLALVTSGDCPDIVTLPLVGCRNALACKTPDWDLRQTPPDWWPCH